MSCGLGCTLFDSKFINPTKKKRQFFWYSFRTPYSGRVATYVLKTNKRVSLRLVKSSYEKRSDAQAAPPFIRPGQFLCVDNPNCRWFFCRAPLENGALKRTRPCFGATPYCVHVPASVCQCICVSISSNFVLPFRSCHRV